MRHLHALTLCLAAAAISTACSRAPAPSPVVPKTVAQSHPDIVSVTMHRSPCYGPCPVYTVTANVDGTTEFDGEQHVKLEGKSVGSISPEDYAYLVRSIDRLQFSTWKDEYRSVQDGCKSYSTDNPTVDIIVTTTSGKKHVSYYYGCGGLALGPKIDLLSKIIDDVTGTSTWIGVEEQ